MTEADNKYYKTYYFIDWTNSLAANGNHSSHPKNFKHFWATLQPLKSEEHSVKMVSV